ncbi:glycosyl hydrolase 115 family protein [Pedobacter alpinus]|uniref:Glycosyl hydrolase 115 family protein n=1 Tax=Pedobacter alpinus TaxID=1590643 RepID=A0ABW5TUY0_9SPHI
MKIFFASIFLTLLFPTNSAKAVETDFYVSFAKKNGAFPLNENGKIPSLYISENEWAGVSRAFKSFAEDLKQVSGKQPVWLSDIKKAKGSVVIVGTIGHSKIIDELIRLKKIDINGVKGKWESSITQVVNNPFPGVPSALVIAGSDKRGTIFGLYTLSAQMGVSPWNWWADVPVKKHGQIYVSEGKHLFKEPAVKYRGIFLNDEAPALKGWAFEKFGGLNHQFYERVFELILRLKGNYLWPAMWGNAFNFDDKLNPVLADEYGIVIGTSHHEPMQRAQQEWKLFGKGEWNYQTNETVLKDFWRNGIKNMGIKESIVTIGMRGDGDEPMTEGTATVLLERIVKDQREIIADVTKKPASETPQLWALYKEVQDYYDKGMRVPDDVTLLLCDDNWGNIRKLPALDAKPRKGGYGIYYHFDYVGGPRSYKWLNTNPISKIREQMNLAYEYGADKIWIVNVGDLKPMEFPTEFFLDYALDPKKWTADNLQQYTCDWVEQQFGREYAKQIAEIITDYSNFNGRRKPEMLSSNTYSLVNYREFETVVEEYNALLAKAQKIEDELPKEYHDAYFQLVLHPVLACANLNELYFTVAKNRWYAKQGRTATNDLAKKAQELFDKDQAISFMYNKETAGGKWNHMMDQTHIGYTGWNQPDGDMMPKVESISIPQKAEMGLAVEGSVLEISADKAGVLQFDANNQKRYIEIFNKGKQAFDFKISANQAWFKLSNEGGKIEKQERILLQPDWDNIPVGSHKVSISIAGAGKTLMIDAIVNKASNQLESQPNFLAKDSYLALEADEFTSANPIKNWEVLPHYGRTKSGVTHIPITQSLKKEETPSHFLTYEINVQNTGKVTVKFLLSPSLDFLDKGGLRFATSWDKESPKIINIHENENLQAWEKAVGNSIREKYFVHTFTTTGKHQLKFWFVDPGVVLQKIIIDNGGLATSYLGPPPYQKNKSN